MKLIGHRVWRKQLEIAKNTKRCLEISGTLEEKANIWSEIQKSWKVIYVPSKKNYGSFITL